MNAYKVTIPADVVADAEAGIEVLVRVHDDGTVEGDIRSTTGPIRVWTPVEIHGGKVEVTG